MRATPPPPIAVVDWWLGKTPQEREVFLAADNTSANVRANIAAVEAYCRSNPYAVFRDSSLRPRPFAPRLLPRGSDGAQPEDEAAVFAYLPRVCAAPAVGIGARYVSSPHERAKVTEAGASHVAAVTARLQAFLFGGGGEQAALVADMMVRVLADAMSAALHRTGTVAAVERHESEQERCRETLVLKLGRVAATAPATPPPHGEEEEEGGRDTRADAPKRAAAKPIAACADSAVGCLGLAACLRAAGGKRPRATGTTSSSVWGALRVCAGEWLPAVVAAAGGEEGTAARHDTTLGFQISGPIEITGRDMALALLRVARLPEYASVVARCV